jgi:hypothetical protein
MINQKITIKIILTDLNQHFQLIVLPININLTLIKHQL